MAPPHRLRATPRTVPWGAPWAIHGAPERALRAVLPWTPRAPALAAVLASLLLHLGCASWGADREVRPQASPVEAPIEEHQLYDRVVAVVDEEAILLSDIEEVLGLGLLDAEAGMPPEEMRSQALEGLIDHQLRYRAAESFGVGQVSVDAIEAQVAQIRDRFPDSAAFDGRLEELGMTETELRQLVARQLQVLSYVDERLGAQVFVSLEDIRVYYEERLVPELERNAQAVPALEVVRERIRGVLREERLLEEVERWTASLRREADVQIFLDEPVGELPPLLRRVESPAATGSG